MAPLTTSMQKPPKPLAGEAKPVLSVTRYDRVSSFLLAAVILIGSIVIWMGALWITQIPADAGAAVTVELIEVPGGDPQGMPGATLDVNNPAEQPTEDPSEREQSDDEARIKKQLANWIDALSEFPLDVDEPTQRDDDFTAGRSGHSQGDSALKSRGAGGIGSGLPREQRWLIHYDPGQTLAAYADQLDHFGIELGVIQNNRLVYISQLASEQPRRRTASPGQDDQRLRWAWHGGNRRNADVALLSKAGIDAREAIVLQFLPRELEEKLAVLERAYAGGRPTHEIRQTSFRVRKNASGLEFYVVEQSFF